MAKRRGKALMDKRQPSSHSISNTGVTKKSMKKKKKSNKNKTAFDPKVGQSSSKSNFVSSPTRPSTSTVVALGSDRGKQKAKKDQSLVRGFIFMCNAKTKSTCYQYSVFGLPKGKIEVVKNINPGMKLFLFDTDLKLLYGIYQATTRGALNIEPMAFNGKFQAQVEFKIFRDCLPLPEGAFKHAIKSNYEHGPKFKQELSGTQVKKLVSLFRPIVKLPSSHSVHLRSNGAFRESFRPARTEEVAKSYPLENSSSRLHYLPMYGTGSQHAVRHEEYNPFEPPTHVTYSQVEFRPVGIDAPPPRQVESQYRELVQEHGIVAPSRRVETRYQELVHEPYFPGKPSIFSQDTHGRNENNHEDSRFACDSRSSALQPVMDREHVPRTTYSLAGYYSQQLSPRTSLTDPVSQAGFSGHPRHTPSSSYHSYYNNNAVTSQDPSSGRVYGGSPQRAVSGSYGYANANLPISSYYSLAGARLSHR